MDWGDGEYERTAKALEPAAVKTVELAAIGEGDRVVDIGCGSGNASILAARADAQVTGVDLSQRLIASAQERSKAEGLSIDYQVGDAQELPFKDSSFDIAMAVFSSIFAPDPDRVAHEMRRVVCPGGRFIFASWSDEGSMSELGAVFQRYLPGPSPRGQWGNEDYIRQQFEVDGATCEITTHELAFSAESPEAWLDEIEQFHPSWRFLRRTVDDSGQRWDACHRDFLDVLERENTREGGFQLDAAYRIALTTIP